MYAEAVNVVAGCLMDNFPGVNKDCCVEINSFDAMSNCLTLYFIHMVKDDNSYKRQNIVFLSIIKCIRTGRMLASESQLIR
jgi:hypothetical protein